VIASIPLTALVFVFGGVGPEDLLRGYIVLLVEVLGLGCVGLFFSALLKRTLAATIATYAVVLAMTVGASFVYVFLSATGGARTVALPDGSTVEQANLAPEGLLWFNPFVADLDVMCPTGTGIGGTCTVITAIMGQPSAGVTNRFVGGGNGGVIAPVPAGPVKVLPDGSMVMPDGSIVGNGALAPGVIAQPIVADPNGGIIRDTYWPRSAFGWLVLSVILVLLSVNLVSPTRRWRPRLPGRGRRQAVVAAGVADVAVGAASTADAVTPAPEPATDPAAAPDSAS
jgi:hypothetical protein